MPIHTAVVGCGNIANSAHLPNITASELFELRCTCDLDPARAEDAAERWGAERSCADWQGVVEDPLIELIVLCTHTGLREELIGPAARAGKAVYVEKPLASSVEEMQKIHRATSENGTSICVGHNRRSGPAVREFRRLLRRARQIGASRPPSIDRSEGRNKTREEKQTHLLLRVCDDSRTWKRWVFKDPHGIIHVEMVHFIDLALWFMEAQPTRVTAVGSQVGNVALALEFGPRGLATITHSMVGNFDYPKELYEACANNVTIALDHHLEVRQRGLEDEPLRTLYPLGSGAELTDQKGIEAFYEATERLQNMLREEKEPTSAFVFPRKGHLEHLEAFGRHILGQGENPCPAEDAIAATTVSLKLVESVKSGKSIVLEGS